MEHDSLVQHDSVTIYVLELEDGKYYVGKTADIDTRIESHMSGAGSAWTKKYKVLGEVERIPGCSSFDEDKYTKIYMTEYGIDNVRGGTYCQIVLQSAQRELLEREIRGALDKCLRCGRSGHFASTCYAKTNADGKYIPARTKKKSRKPATKIPVCYRCGRKGHKSTECYAKTLVGGGDIATCDRCGREGHESSGCYAKTNADGGSLE